MADRDLQRLLMERLLANELENFRRALEEETPGLSDGEIERYMRAARKFADYLLGLRARTHGRKPRAL